VAKTENTLRDNRPQFPKPAPPGKEMGVIAIMFAGALVIIIGFFVLALDLSMLYNRKMELQNAADTLALASAHELNGTSAGISNALQKASERFTNPSTGHVTYGYGKQNMNWSDLVMEFGSSPSGPWRLAPEAQANPDGLLFAKADTSGLTASYGNVNTIFLRVFTQSSTAFTSARAVAGRSAMKVTPLGICAMRDEAHRNHNSELEEYGFRRGVAYNLLDLARPGDTAGKTFIVNPVASSTPITAVTTLAPFVCTGTVAMARLTGGKVTVSPTFPISSLYYHLNSRFGAYSASAAACDPVSAPSDTNIKEYPYNGGSPWMSTTPLGQSAALLNTTDQRWTIAGPDTAPTGTTDAQFGPLWSYAKAVKYSSYVPGQPEPASGYETFDTTAWSSLYSPGSPKTSTTTPYPSSQTTPTPYSYTSGTTFYKAPSATNKSVPNRRVLNLPLLACPVSGTKATVVGIGKFFMTVQATDKSLFGEFAGLVPEQSLGTRVLLYH
jgi:hypothetical protein